jgi:adenylyltransferase/sulfurtransferase
MYESKFKSTISAIHLKDMMDNRESFILLDVRQPEEYEICHIEGSLLVPLEEIEEHLGDFCTDRTYVIHCKEGVRSMEAIGIMKKKGFQVTLNLDGGILSWAKMIEPTMESD